MTMDDEFTIGLPDTTKEAKDFTEVHFRAFERQPGREQAR